MAAKAVGDGRGLPAINQHFNQLVYLQERPDQVQVALEAGQALLGEVQRVCAAGGVRLIVLYIPPPADVEPRRFGDLFEEVSEALELTPASRRLADRLADELLAFLRDRGVEVIDGRAVFADRPVPLYWQKDHHVNLDAHGLLAEALRPAVEAEL